MDVPQQQLFGELWTDLQATFALDASVDGFLDYLQTKDGVLSFSPHWCHLVRQNRAALFDQLGASLAASRDGYDVVLEYARRDSLRFLYDKHTDRERLRRAHLRAAEKALKYGNVPPLPKYYIERADLMSETKSQLLAMSPSTCNALNVYGMDGTGKTSLIAACLRDADVLRRANYKVHWIDLGRVDGADAEELLARMYALYHKLLIDDGALADLPADRPADVGLMRDRLLNLFTRAAYARALLVLDNVRAAAHATAVECFGVCGLVIISREKFRLDAERVWHRELVDTLTAHETRRVFAAALDGAEPPSNEHARAIVEWCRGDLGTTTLCASLMEERRASLLNRENGARVWKRFREELFRKDSRVTTKRNTTIAMRLEGLKERDDALHAKYWDFAIFLADVNVTSHVLALLWQADVGDVEETMRRLCDQSFAVREYNEQIDSYVYGVSHVYLNYLRSKHPRLGDTHRRLLDAYRERYEEYHRFPDDNYIYQYVGYHLVAAAYLDHFVIYRDLRFLEAKIRATGVADVLRDFELYAAHIARPDDELVEFVERYGRNVERYPRTSLLQSALQLPADSGVRRMAFAELRRSDPFGLYFEWTPSKRRRPYVHQLAIKPDLEVACFAHDDPDRLLVGTAAGDVQLWDQRYDKMLQEFKGHVGRIAYLRAADAKFLSISDDGTAKVWQMDEPHDDDDGADNLPSPACVKQKNHQAFFGANQSVESCVTYAVDGDRIVAADFVDDVLVAGTEHGRLLLWRRETQTFEKDLKTRITAVRLSHNLDYVYAALTADVLVYAASGGEFISKACCKHDILALHTVRCGAVDAFVVVQARRALTCSIMLQDGNCYDIRKDVIVADAPAAHTCSAMTDGYLVVGGADDRVCLWDVAGRRVAARFDAPDDGSELMGIDAMTHPDERGVEILLASCRDRSVRLWHVEPAEEVGGQQQAARVDAFAARWRPARADFVVALVRQRRLVVLDGDATLDVDDDVVSVASFGEAFVYARHGGAVHLWDATTTTTKIMDLKDEVSHLEALADTVVVAGTARGVLFAYRTGSAHKLRDEGRGDNVVCAFHLAQRLVVVSQRKISCWDRRFESEEVLHAAATAADFGAGCVCDANKLCVSFGSNFKVFTLDASLKIEGCVVKKTAHCVTACRFSNDGKYLALGTQSGDIEVFDADGLTLSSVLRLHSSPVRHLQFAAEGPILLSLAEQMAWWNVKLAALQLAQTTATRRSYRSRSNSARSPGQRRPANLLLQVEELRVADMTLERKRGRPDMEHLLAAIKLHGARASHVVAADRWRAFLSVDDLGNLYNMRVVDEAAERATSVQ